jgi:AraC family transcriptional activator of pobA
LLDFYNFLFDLCYLPTRMTTEICTMEFYDPEGFFTDVLSFRSVRADMGHFNVFPSDPWCGPNAKPAPYSRRSYYKISLVVGNNVYHYANRSIGIEDSALFFGNPMVPYSCRASGPQTGYFCIFTPDFFKDFGSLHTYPVFQPAGDPIFHLTPQQRQEVQEVFKNMETELQSNYAYKYDSIRTMVLSLIHRVMKMRPAEPSVPTTANDRICTFFIELLERQFPIDSALGQMQLRRPVDFADHLSVHINHLNRAVKTVTGQTTSQYIAGRVVKEARILLKQTDWPIANIGYCLGFSEPSNFISFFKRYVQATPREFRN